MNYPDASEFLPLPFFPFEELPRNTPINIEDAATALFLEKGDLNRAAARLRVTTPRLDRTIRKSLRLIRLIERLSEALGLASVAEPKPATPPSKSEEPTCGARP